MAKKPSKIPLPPKTDLDRLKKYVRGELKNYPVDDEWDEGFIAGLKLVLRKIQRVQDRE